MNSQDNSGRWLLLIPIALGIFLIGSIGYMAALQRASYRTVKLLLFPLTFLLTQFFSGMLFLCVGWFIALLLGNTPLANYVVGHVTDLNLLGFVFGENTTPIWHIVIFQFFAWLLLGRMFARHITFSIYDFAIQSIGTREGIHPYYVRESILQTDDGYAEAAQFYAEVGKPPLLGLILIALSPTPVAEYY